MAGKQIGPMMDYGMPGAKTPKETTIIVKIPQEVGKYLSFFSILNSATWALVGVCYWLIDGPTPDWLANTLGVSIFVCTVISPIFVSFIKRVPWGQKEGG